MKVSKNLLIDIYIYIYRHVKPSKYVIFILKLQESNNTDNTTHIQSFATATYTS